MKVVITRSMCVFGDNKSTVRFDPSTSDNPFVEASNQVYARLKRANAAHIYQEEQCIAADPEQPINWKTETDSHKEISKKKETETIVSKDAKAFKPSMDSPKKA
ncbi:hypothetical protein V4B17_03650 [Bartonella sp. B23]